MIVSAPIRSITSMSTGSPPASMSATVRCSGRIPTVVRAKLIRCGLAADEC